MLRSKRIVLAILLAASISSLFGVATTVFAQEPNNCCGNWDCAWLSLPKRYCDTWQDCWDSTGLHCCYSSCL
jgi:hypothetical protein